MNSSVYCVLTGVHFDHRFSRLGEEEAAGRACNKIWVFDFPVLTIKNIYAQSIENTFVLFTM